MAPQKCSYLEMELQRQTVDMDAMELDAARLCIRLGRERETFQRLQATYRRKFDSSLLSQSRTDVAGWLDESTAPTSIRQNLQRSHERQDKRHYAKEHGQER